MTELATALQRWESGRRAARQRFDEAVGELDRILAQPIISGLPDAERWARTIENSERRLGELRRGLEDAWAPLEHSVLAAMEATNGDAQQGRRLQYQLAEQRKRRDQLFVYMAREGRALMAARRSDAARLLFAQARLEWARSRPCGRCGADIDVGAVAEPTDFVCNACGHAAPFGPGPATARYVSALDALSDEQTLESWTSYQDARRTFDGYAWPTEGDFDVLETAARTWLHEWVEVRRRLLPLGESLDAAAELDRRMISELRGVNGDAARAGRARMGAAMRSAAAGDMAAVLQLAETEGLEAAVFVGSLCRCLHEHGNRDAAWQALALLHHVTGEAAERNGWMQQRLMSLDDKLRTR